MTQLRTHALSGAVLCAVLAAPLLIAPAGAVEPPLDRPATLLFEADSLEGSLFADQVLVGDQLLTELTADYQGFTAATLEVPADRLSSGRVQLSFKRGSARSGPSSGGTLPEQDDFLVRNVRLRLADGTVLRDPRYPSPTTELYVGDGGGPTGAPPFANPDRTSNFYLPNVVLRDFRFDVPVSRRSGSDAPDVPTLPTATAGPTGAVRLDTTVADAAGRALDVKVLRALESGPSEARGGAQFTKPIEEAAVHGGALPPATATEVAALLDADAGRFVTDVDAGFPSQAFTLPVTPEQVAVGRLDAEWEGRTSPGRGATLYAFDTVQKIWSELATLQDAAPADGRDVVLRGVVDTATMVDAGVVRLLVQERRYEDADTDFSFAWETDTQYLSEGYPDIYEAMNNWIVDNAAAQKIAYTIHTGDIVQNSTTGSSSDPDGVPVGIPEVAQQRLEYERASKAMKILEDGNMPYGMVTGNHDVGPAEDHALYNEFFPASRYSGKPFYGGGYDGYRNHYDLIRAGSTDWLMLYLDWTGTTATATAQIAWAQGVIEAHPNHKVIFNTHQYLDLSANRGGAIALRYFNEVIAPYPNVVMALSGHYHGAAYAVRRVPAGTAGPERIVLEILHDYQSGPEGGSGYLRLLRFDEQTQSFDVVPYSPYVNDFEYDGYSNAVKETNDDVTLSLPYGERDRHLETDRVTVAARTEEVLATATAGAASTYQATLEDVPLGTRLGYYVRADAPGGSRSESDTGRLSSAEDPTPVVPEVPVPAVFLFAGLGAVALVIRRNVRGRRRLA